MTDKQWLEERKTYIGGSDIGSIIGCNPYRTALDVYMDKTGETLDDSENDAIYWGHQLEDIVACEYSKRTGYAIEKPQGLIRHSEYPFIAANIDRWVDNGNHILECKTAGYNSAKNWQSGTTADLIPNSYQCQVGYYAAITGVPFVDIAVLIGGQDFRIYTYKADKEFQEKLIRAACLFWNKYIILKRPPKPTMSKDLEHLHPKSNGLEIEANPEILEKLEALSGLKSQDRELHKEIDHLSFQIKEYMQDNEALIDNTGNIIATWKSAKSKTRLDAKKLEQEYRDIYQQCLKESSGSRMFLVK